MTKTMVLIGNPNCGKTTLFNALTGDSKTVGNWAGVTVMAEAGRFSYLGEEFLLVDLPGLYSLDTPSQEQQAVTSFLHTQRPDLIVNVVDATNLERQLYLTTQIMEQDIPVLVALNMADELVKRGISVDEKKLTALLHLPCVKISAARGKGLSHLMRRTMQAPEIPRPSQAFFDGKARYAWIQETVPQVLRQARGGGSFSGQLDAVLCHRFWAFPIFIVILFAMFYLCFGPLGRFLQSIFQFFFFSVLPRQLDALLSLLDAGPVLRSLLLDGVLCGLGSVMVFLPQLTLLFSVMAFLEYSGYMARAAFITDRLMGELGLSGMSFIPMLLGFGCSVPAILSCRLLENRRERLLTMLMIPFMSCSAKLPVYALLGAAFFGEKAPWVLGGLYLLGISAAILTAFLFRPWLAQRKQSFFLMEMPPYRRPVWSCIWRVANKRVWDFLSRAGTVILCASCVVWFLGYFDPSLHVVADAESSVLAWLGRAIAPFFAPLGLADWRLIAALLSGLVAKEAVVSTLSVLLAGTQGLAQAFYGMLDFPAVFALLTFVLLYTPCVATLSAVGRESGSKYFAFGMAGYQLALAYVISFVIYRIILCVD